jgi:serine/threonine protein kinase
MSDHRNIVRLLALSWDEIDLANDNTDLFAPLLITELAHEITPTLQGYYQDRSTDRAWGVSREFIADIADGVTVLHTCGVIHGDLKPENILLFRDRESGCGLIAKIGDFGYAGVDGLRRGRTRRWTAPECLDGCPSDILADARMMPIAADVYSFGLLVLFILLNGRSPTEALGLSDEGFDKLRFSSNGLETFQTLFRHDVNDRPYWDKHEKHPSSLNQTVQVILEETLCRAPSRRTSSLKHIRKLITGE